MEWLIIIVVIVIVLVVVGSASNAKSERQMDEMTDSNKQKVIDYCKERMAKLESDIQENIKTKKPIFLHTKDSAIELLAEHRLTIETIKVFEKHLKTVLISDKYSKQAKAELKASWFSFILAYGSFIGSLDYGAGDPSFDNTRECKEDFIAKLEAFGFDGVKEEQGIRESIKKEYKKRFSDNVSK